MALVDRGLSLSLDVARVVYRVTPLPALWRKVAREDLGVVETRHTEPLTGRSYRVIARRDHDRRRAAGVLFVLHAYASSPDTVLDGLRLRRRAAVEWGLVLVVPEGTRDSAGNPFWNATAGCSGEGPRTVDDVAYLRAVLADVPSHASVDPDRIYALGVSNGAFMAHRWASEPGGDLRAVACISGTGPGPEDPPCAPTVPVRVLSIHGTHDELIHFDGGRGANGYYPSVDETVAMWRAVCLANGAPRTERRRSLLQGTTRRDTWTGARGTVARWVVEGGRHHLYIVRWMMRDVLAFLDAR